MTMILELRVQYFNSETLKGVEYTKEIPIPDSIKDPRVFAKAAVVLEEMDADDVACMPGTFYYEYDFLVDEGDERCHML